MSPFRNILITGASSGIGEALALHYAAPGAMLFLSGRHEQRLAAVAQACTLKGASIHQAVLDVTDQAAMRRWVEDADKQGPLDLVIANAGISGGTGGAGASNNWIAQDRLIFDVNVTGVLNTIEPVLPLLLARGQGHVAIMSSLASFSAWPGAPAYAASKNAVRVYGEGLRGALAGTGVNVSVICPGFVISRMTEVNDFPMLFIMPADRAASIISRGLARNRARIAFPWPMYLLAGFMGILPVFLAQSLLRHLPEKPAQGIRNG